MPRSLASRHATDAELAILKVLWERGRCTIRELTDRLYPDGGPSHYSTVQKLLERLEAKRFVDQTRRDRVKVFTAIVDRRTLIAGRLRDTADRLCEGSLTPLLTQLVSSADLSAEEIAALRRLVDRLDPERRSGGG